MKYEQDFQDDDLIIALSSLRQFCLKKAEFDSGKSFIDFYIRTQEIMKIYAVQKPSRYFAEKLIEMPAIATFEIDNRINKSDNYRDECYPSSGGISIWTGIIYFLKLIRILKRETDDSTADKLRYIAAIADNLIYVLKHPGFEDLYYSSKKTDS